MKVPYPKQVFCSMVLILSSISPFLSGPYQVMLYSDLSLLVVLTFQGENCLWDEGFNCVGDFLSGREVVFY